MFDNLIKYYLKDVQVRINGRIDEINRERAVLKASGDKRYKNLKAIKNTHLYGNKPRLIKEIREADAEFIVDKLSITVAESLRSNIKLKPELKTASSKESTEIRLKKSNLEFISLQELLWGFDDELTRNNKFNFFLHLFLDLVNNIKYSFMVHDVLVDYVPFARYIALEKSVNEDVEFGAMCPPEYKHTNIDVFAEAVFAFCMTETSDEVMERFTEFLHTPYKYDSKDKKGRFLIKEVSVNYQNFEQAFSQVLDDVLEPISNMETYRSLGKRAYDIIIDDFKIDSDLIRYSMARSPESYGYYLTRAEQTDVDVMSDLLVASENYIEQLIETQQDFYGNIEKEYFESEMFSPKATAYFSEDRFIQLQGQAQLEELEKLASEYHFSENEFTSFD